MTPRHPWRRRWRETWHPLLWLIVVGALLAVALGFSIPPADATPAASPGEQYAHDHAADICIALDERPTIPGVLGVLLGVEATGLSTFESGVAVAESVINICPIHANLLRQFVAHYKTDRSVAA